MVRSMLNRLQPRLPHINMAKSLRDFCYDVITDKMIKTKTKSSKKSNAWKYFDDCLICQAMEKADKRGRNLSEKELTEAFRKANEKQAKSGK